jgi:uncharacterized protein (TIGR02246 family)
MRALLTVSVWLMTVLQASGPAARPAALDEAAIRDVVKQYVAAHERSDPSAIGALFTDGADQLTSSGEWRKGRDEIVRGTLASSTRASGTRTITLETIRFPARGVAIADGRYEIAGAQEGTRRMWTTFVLVRTSDRWRIAAIRNMLPAPPASPAVR